MDEELKILEKILQMDNFEKFRSDFENIKL